MRGQGSGKRGSWTTCYLHTDLMFQQRLAGMHSRIRQAALAVDEEHWGICARAEATHQAPVATRCVELHTVGTAAGLTDSTHYDYGSCVTVDIMLRYPEAGGELETLEADQCSITHQFEVSESFIEYAS